MLIPLENAFSLDHGRSIDPARLTRMNTLLVPYSGFLTGGLQPGQVVLVNGATGHFGSATVAVALAMGAARVVATGRNEQALNRLAPLFGSRVRPVRLPSSASAEHNRLPEATTDSSITYSAYSLSEDEAISHRSLNSNSSYPIRSTASSLSSNYCQAYFALTLEVCKKRCATIKPPGGL